MASGLLNIFRWYTPMGFFFTIVYYWTAWALAGSVVVHIGVNLPIIRRSLTTKPRREPVTGGLSRRGLLATVSGAADLIVVAFAGQTLRPLASLSVSRHEIHVLAREGSRSTVPRKPHASGLPPTTPHGAWS